jgi:hypothetical protein
VTGLLDTMTPSSAFKTDSVPALAVGALTMPSTAAHTVPIAEGALPFNFVSCAANTVLVGASGDPSCTTVPLGALPGSGSITVNGQTCTLNSSCNVNAGAGSGTLAVNAGAGLALTGASNFTYSSGTTLAGGSTAVLDMSAASSERVPVANGLTATTNGQVGYDSTAQVPHMAVNSADAKVATFTGSPASTDCVNWASSTQVGDAGQPCPKVGGLILAVCIGSVASATMTTNYLMPTSTTLTCSSAGEGVQTAPVAFTPVAIAVHLGGAPGGSVTDTFELYDTSTSTQVISCSITGAATGCTGTNSTNVVHSGDNFYIADVAGASSATSNPKVSFQIQ